MPSTMRTAFAANNDQEVIRRRTAEDRNITKLAFKEHSSKREAQSRKVLNKPLEPHQIYRGEDLKRGSR